MEKPIPQVAHEQQIESQSTANFVGKVNEPMNIDTTSEHSSSTQFVFLSSNDPSELSLSEREVKMRTNSRPRSPS